MKSRKIMRLVGTRTVNNAILCMQWNNKMDLLAYGTRNGEVVVMRLNWQKIATFAGLEEGVVVRSLSWQTDETLLLAAYSNGVVMLYDAEHDEIVTSYDYEEDIETAYFSKAIECTTTTQQEDWRRELLPELPALSNLEISQAKASAKKCFPKSTACFITILTASGNVHILLSGALEMCAIDLSEFVVSKTNFKAYDARFSSDFDALYVLVQDGAELKVLCLSNIILQESLRPLVSLATHCSMSVTTRSYISETLENLNESWESFRLEMDNKLAKYCHSLPEGESSAQFLELLLFGHSSPDHEGFLRDELTDKSVKKIANSANLCLSNLQSLVNDNLLNAALELFYIQNTVRGYSRMQYFYSELLSEPIASDAVLACGSFILKTIELRQVLDHIAFELKLFHRWLLIVIPRLEHEEAPRNLTAEEVEILGNFLYSMEDQDDNDNIDCGPSTSTQASKNKHKRRDIFRLERLGQYLEEGKLPNPIGLDKADLWQRLIDENNCFTDSTVLIPHDQDLSLVQQYQEMKQHVEIVYHKPLSSISEKFKLSTQIICNRLPTGKEFEAADCVVRFSHIADTKAKKDYIVTTISCDKALLIEFKKRNEFVRYLCISLQSGPMRLFSSGHQYENLRFVDLQFYNQTTLSIAAQTPDSSTGHLIQLTLSSFDKNYAHRKLEDSVDLTYAAVPFTIHSDDVETQFQDINGTLRTLAVVGSRKIASITTNDSKRLTIIELEVDDDEDDTEMTPTTSAHTTADLNFSLEANKENTPME